MAKAGDGSMRDALSFLRSVLPFILGKRLLMIRYWRYWGAVDTEVFSRLLRMVLKGDVTASIHILEDLIVGGRELKPVCRRLYLVYEKSPSCKNIRKPGGSH